MSAELIRGTATDIPLEDESVDLIVTSPPYFALRSYTDGGEHYDNQIGSEATPAEFLRALWAVSDECWRVLKPGGSCWINLGDKYAGSGGHNNSNIGAPKERAPSSYNKAAGVPAKSLMGLPWRYVLGLTSPDPYRDCYEPGDHPQWILRAEVVWDKPNGLPESVTDRVRRSHEQWFHLTKQGRYFAAVDEVREPYSERSFEVYGKRALSSAAPQASGARWTTEEVMQANPLGKLPGSVWRIPSEPLKVPEHLGVDHFAAFPQEWPRRIILGWSPSGVCVECGEGRRPVVEKEKNVYYGEGQFRSGAQQVKDGAATVGWKQDEKWRTEATITGYACDCPTPDAPTRPAVVLDPFCGTGTTVMVARALGRYGIGLDLSADYLRLARWRVFESGHFEKKQERVQKEAEKQAKITDLRKQVKRLEKVNRVLARRLSER